MPRIKLPDGAYANFPDNMPTADIEAALAARDAASAPAPAPAATAPIAPLTLAPVDSSPMYRDAAQLAKNIGGGIASGAGKLIAQYGMALPNAVRDLANRQMPGTTSRQLGTEAEQVGPVMGAQPESSVFQGAKAVPALVATTAAMAPGVNAVASALPRALGAARPIIADTAVNAAYSGAEAGAEGKGITDVMKAAGMGAAGAGAGHFVGGLAQRGISPIMADSARTLLQHDILPTYGQAFGRGASQAENVAGYLPIVGPAIDMARGTTLKQYSRAEVNRALEPLGQKTSKIGEDAVQEGRDIISREYNAAVPQTHLPAYDAQQAIAKTQQSMQTMPMLSQPQIDSVNKYVIDKIQPELAFSQRTGNKVPGRTAKELDEELGGLARKYADSPDPTHHPLGQAFGELRDNLRDVLAGNTAAVAKVRSADTAFRELMAAREAAKRAGKDIGEFTPNQMFQSAGGEDMGAGTLNRAARELLPTTGGPFRRVGQIGGFAGAGALDPLITGVGMAGAHALYSRPVRSAVLRGVLNGRGRSLPFTTAQLAAQVGREAVNPD